jgi:D-inositol-3-phosphate glycosyltransferase
MKRRHLALITLHADPATPSGVFEGGGTHSYIRELIAGVPKSDWNLTVLTRWADPLLPEEQIISENAKIIRLKIGEVGPMNKSFLDDLHKVTLAAAGAVLARGAKVDLLHSVYWNSGRLAMDLSREQGLSYVHTVISNGHRRWIEGACDQPSGRLEMEKRVFASAHAIFCVSEQERRDLVEYYQVFSNKIVVVGRPVAFSFGKPSHDEWGNPSKPRMGGTDR